MPQSPAATGQQPEPPRRARPASYWLSMALFGLFVAGIIGFFWVGGFFAEQRTPPDAASGAGAPEMLDRRTIVVRSITLEGRDEQGRPFRLRAARSLRPEKGGKQVRLLDVVGELTRASGRTLTFRADEALYQEDTEQADLKGNVVIRDPGRWTLTGTLVHVDTKTHTLTSERPVTVKVRAGVIHARGMKAEKDTGRIVFSGPVSSSFEVETNDEAPAGASDAAADDAAGKTDAAGETGKAP